MQHAAAIRNKVAFFNTFAAMGGADRMADWVAGETKFAFKDHVHLTSLGYARWADELSSALFADYARWRTAQKLPPSPALASAPVIRPSP
jgi:lysophospholipase L1-like esterase